MMNSWLSNPEAFSSDYEEYQALLRQLAQERQAQEAVAISLIASCLRLGLLNWMQKWLHVARTLSRMHMSRTKAWTGILTALWRVLAWVRMRIMVAVRMIGKVEVNGELG